jgi:hypothetical protein
MMPEETSPSHACLSWCEKNQVHLPQQRQAEQTKKNLPLIYADKR